jgi:aspartokinase
MTNLADEVRDFLNRNLSIVKCLNSRIINVRALAFFIIKELKLGASVHAVMSAIRRYEKPNNKQKNYPSLDLIFQDSKISTKSHLVLIRVKRNFSSLKTLIPQLFDEINHSAGEVLRIFEGRESIKFVIDHSKKEDVIKLIPKEDIINIDEDLGEINIHLSEKFEDRPGILAPIINELAINDINTIEVVGCTPELIIIVKEKDISQSHDVLLRFLYGKK